MVRGDYGHWYCFGVDDINPFRYSSALLLVNCLLPTQYPAIRSSFHRFFPPIHLISRNMECDDPRPNQFALLGDNPDGLCYTH